MRIQTPIIGLGLLLLAGCVTPSASRPGVSVVTTFYPLTFLTERIVGGTAVVRQVIPPGAEPHDFEPSPADVAHVLSANVVVQMGAGLEPWMERLASTVADAWWVKMDEHLPLVPPAEDDHGHDGVDPHAWLDPVLMREMADVIRDALLRAMPEHEADIRQNAERLRAELTALHGEYEAGLRSCEERAIIVSHDAFQYLGRRYGLTIHAITGISPEEEPSARSLAELVDLAREEGIDVVFFESLVPPTLAQTLAREIGARTDVLHTIEGLTEEQRVQGEDYFSLMRENLEHLRAALLCS